MDGVEFLVTMTTRVPDGVPDEQVDQVRAREAAHTAELAEAGHVLRLWRPPLQPGEWRTLGLFVAEDAGALEQVLASMPLRVWRHDEVTPLAPHPNDPGRDHVALDPGKMEFLTTFTVRVPAGTTDAVAAPVFAGEARRAGELAHVGSLLRLWRLPGEGHNLGHWQAGDAQHLQQQVASLPLAEWFTVETVPLTRHPNDPLAVPSRA